LKEPFRTCAKNFLAALKKAGATVSIAATLRPPERAYLMHYAFQIGKNGIDPSTVPPMDGVDIDWTHRDASGNAVIADAKKAAQQMITAYEIVFSPALTSRHTQGLAIDMDISWNGNLTVNQPNGSPITITTAPRTGANSSLQSVGAAYGVHKLATDPPHWSSDGH